MIAGKQRLTLTLSLTPPRQDLTHTVSARRQVDPRSPQGTLVSCASGAGTVEAGCPPPSGGTPCPDSAASRGARALLARRAKTVQNEKNVAGEVRRSPPRRRRTVRAWSVSLRMHLQIFSGVGYDFSSRLFPPHLFNSPPRGAFFYICFSFFGFFLIYIYIPIIIIIIFFLCFFVYFHYSYSFIFDY